MSTKRAVELAEKLTLDKNAGLRPRVKVWIADSEDYATMMMEKYGPNDAQKSREGYRLLYILNHLCPSLYHYHRAPDPQRFRGDIDGFNRAQQKHFLENTQAGLRDRDGALIQEGVEYSKESFDAFCETVLRICAETEAAHA